MQEQNTSRGNDVQVHNYKSLFQSTGTARNDAFNHRRAKVQLLTRFNDHDYPLHYSLPRWTLSPEAFTHRGFYTQTPLHTDAFTFRRFYIQTLLHTDPFTHRPFYTQKLLHTETFTHRSFYTQTLSHTEAFTHKHFHTQRPDP